MLVRGLRIEGLAGLPRFEARSLGRVVRVGGAPRARTALADALALSLGSFDPNDLKDALQRLGFGHEVQVEGAPLPEAVVLGRRDRARALLDEPEQRQLKVSLELELDPPQFGAVRQHALRDPSLASALGEEAALLRMSVGWAFTRALELVSLSQMNVRVGAVSATPGQETPWRDTLLKGMGGRCSVPGRLRADPSVFAAAQRSSDPERRARAAAMREALAMPPFSLGVLEVIELPDGRLELAVGPSLTPLRALGPGAVEAVGLCEAVFLSQAEILVLEQPGALWDRPDELVQWLEGLIEASPSPLEQLWLLGVPAPHQLVAAPEPSRRVLGRVLSR